MNSKPTNTFPIKLILLAIATAALTIYFIYAQLMRQSFLVFIPLLALIGIVLLTKRYTSINALMIKILLFSILIYFCIDYGIFFTRGVGTQVIGFFIVIFVFILFFNPKLMTYLNLFFIFFIPSANLGAKGTKEQDTLIDSIGTMFGRGQGKYGISYVNLLLILTAISIIIFQMIIKKQEDKGKIQCNLYKYFRLINAVFIIYMLWGIGLGIKKIDILSPMGVINITNLTIFVFIMHRLFRTEKDLEQLKIFFLGSMLARGLFSIIRFIFFGGDPRNSYANYDNLLSVHMSMQDIGDGLIQFIALFYALWVLFISGDRIISRKETLFYWMVASVGLFNIVFSYRRTAWFGLLLALTWLIHNLQFRNKITAVFITIILGATIFTGVAANRFNKNAAKQINQGMFSDLVDKKGDIAIKEGRFGELYMAWQTIKDNLIFGVGPWGKYQFNIKDSSVRSSFVHNSFLFMLLKMGLVGLFLFISIFYSYIHFWLKKRKTISMHARGFAEASFAGFIFFIPHIVGGTPIIEYRHMILIGFCISVPYIIYHIDKSHKAV
ncbi:O-antigen ligase domain-containing protein [candidate division WS5 bacterium]|uniref:O-antigen ligase domain-containing protein n=1 Tax=candidate division WS5 bacterium TaxID=2093353 RepID=A0A419DDT2_9BACT|nr:MAG: O-antigen ligase domain-containing protein [candidate division WS5 bacterium]